MRMLDDYSRKAINFDLYEKELLRVFSNVDGYFLYEDEQKTSEFGEYRK